MFSKCLTEEYEIFLIFRSTPSNFGTWMSRKARFEPGRRIEGGCVRIHNLVGIFRKSIFVSQAQENILCNPPSQPIKSQPINLHFDILDIPAVICYNKHRLAVRAIRKL